MGCNLFFIDKAISEALRKRSGSVLAACCAVLVKSPRSTCDHGACFKLLA